MLRIIYQFYNDVKLLADIIYLNNVLFLTSISEYIHYGIVAVVDNLKYILLEEELRSILYSYTIRRFRIMIIYLDI